MTRFLLILSLVFAGTVPTSLCREAAASETTMAAVDASCEMSCCGVSCCCVAEPTPASHPAPDAPATPPRGADVLPLSLHVAPSIYELATPADPGRAAAFLLEEARFRGRHDVEAQPLLCRWLT